jgi:hypothetical protein
MMKGKRMSRYQFSGKEPRYRIVVGWDASLASFFWQVEDLAWETNGRVIDEDASIGDSPDEGLLVWVGADAPIVDPQQLVRAVASYGTIPEATLARLRQDQSANKPLTKAYIPPNLTRAAAKRYRKREK